MRLDGGVADGLRRMGVSEEDIEREVASQTANAPVTHFEVHEDCWESWLFFMQVCRQWRYVLVSSSFGSVSVRAGLSWPGIESVIRMRRVPRDKWDTLLDDLQVIEGAVLEADQDN